MSDLKIVKWEAIQEGFKSTPTLRVVVHYSGGGSAVTYRSSFRQPLRWNCGVVHSYRLNRATQQAVKQLRNKSHSLKMLAKK